MQPHEAKVPIPRIAPNNYISLSPQGTGQHEHGPVETLFPGITGHALGRQVNKTYKSLANRRAVFICD